MADVSSARIQDFSSAPIRLENGLEGSIMEFESGTPATPCTCNSSCLPLKTINPLCF